MNSNTSSATTAMPVERMAQFTPAHTGKVWHPNIGDYLIGKIIEIRDVPGHLRENQQLIIQDIRNKRDNLKAVWLHKDLQKKLFPYRARQGDLIGLMYLGKKRVQGGFEAHVYNVVVDKTSTADSEGYKSIELKLFEI